MRSRSTSGSLEKSVVGGAFVDGGRAETGRPCRAPSPCESSGHAGGMHALAVDIGGEGDVAELRDHVRAHLRVVGQAAPIVDDDDAGTRTALRIVINHVALERRAGLVGVVDGARDRASRKPGTTPRRRAGRNTMSFHGEVKAGGRTERNFLFWPVSRPSACSVRRS